MAIRQHRNGSDIDRLLDGLSPELRAELAPLRRSMRAGNLNPEYIHHTLFKLYQFDLWLNATGRPGLRSARREDIQSYMDHLLDRFAVPTVVSYRAALRTYYRFLHDELRLREDVPTDGVRLTRVPELRWMLTA